MRGVFILLALALLAAQAEAGRASPSPYQNVTQGGALRPGVYGRIEFGQAPPPPLIHPRPVIATELLVPAAMRPVYLYVPPGHARKWKQHCARYEACSTPVYFVRMDDSPSRLGAWKRTAGRDASTDRPGSLGQLFSLR